MLFFTYLVGGLATLMTIVFGVIKTISSPAAIKKAAFGIGGLILMFVIGYVLSSGEQATQIANDMATRGIETTEVVVKRVGMLINVFFGLILVAVALLFVPAVKKLIGK